VKNNYERGWALLRAKIVPDSWLRHWLYRSKVLIVIFVVALAAIVPTVSSADSPCVATISPNSFNPASQVTLDISVANHTADAMVWVRVTRPSNNYTVNGISVGGWSDTTTDSGTTLTGGSITGGSTLDFQLAVATELSNSPSEAWDVQVSTDANGAGAIACTGNRSTSVQGSLVDSGNIVISNIQVSQISTSSAIVSWDTDNVTSSIIHFGTSAGYGQNTAVDSSLELAHQQTITGLAPGTTYHFQVGGKDQNGNIAASTDSTFLTQANIANAPTGGGGTTTTTSPGGSRIVGTNDKIPPKVQIDTPPQSSYKDVPTLQGTASDDNAVNSVDYSTDDGKNWLPVDTLKDAGRPKVSFSFKPILLEDGNYPVVVRALDSSGNETATATRIIVIDTLPPIVGVSVLSVGTQFIQPDSHNAMTALSEVDQKITLNAVGGPTSIVINALQTGTDKTIHSFSLTYSTQTGLWSGVLSFQAAGTYDLIAKATDGAQNITTRVLGKITALQTARITAQDEKLVKDATVTLYTRDPDTERWEIWDGKAYGQPNPHGAAKGTYGFYLPPGVYYMRLDAPGYKRITTNSFQLTTPSIVATDMHLINRPGFKLGSRRVNLPWPALGLTAVTPHSSPSESGSVPQPSVPNFNLPMTTGNNLSLAGLYGKPTVLTFISTWAPLAQDQIAILSETQQPETNFIAVSAGENIAKLSVYTKLAGYNVSIAADKDNVLASALQPNSLPSHYFLDRHGVVKKVMVGVLSKQELLDNVQY
jgi:hypothetical protein